MIEKKTCVVCNNDIIIINCHYTCKICGFSENCHDFPHMIDMGSGLEKSWYRAILAWNFKEWI